MIPLIESKRPEIAELCRRFHVRKLEIFGSAARGTDFDPKRSDVDFLVEFDRTHPDATSFAKYLDFKESLEALLGRSVDLVNPNTIENPYLRAAIDRSRQAVYGA